MRGKNGKHIYHNVAKTIFRSMERQERHFESGHQVQVVLQTVDKGKQQPNLEIKMPSMSKVLTNFDLKLNLWLKTIQLYKSLSKSVKVP